MPRSRPALFLDRDGVINRDTGYLIHKRDVVFRPGIAEAIGLANRAGWRVFVVTNQSGVARGLFTEEAVLSLHGWMAARLAERGARIDAWRYCPHLPEAPRAAYARVCRCRKPGPGMIEALLVRYPVDRATSHLIGDSPRDIEAARAAGITGRLIGWETDIRETVAAMLSTP